MSELLQNKTRVIESGVNGEVTTSMIERLTLLLNKNKSGDSSFLGKSRGTSFVEGNLPAVFGEGEEKESVKKLKLVCILGGTNDVGRRAQHSHQIVDNIIKLHRIAQEGWEGGNAVYTVALTMPQLQWPEPQATVRLEVNAGIRKFAAENKNNVVLCDLETTFEQSLPDNAKFWSFDMVKTSLFISSYF